MTVERSTYTTAQIRVSSLREADVVLHKGEWLYVYGVNEEEENDRPGDFSKLPDLDTRDTVVRYALDSDRRHGAEYCEDFVVLYRNPCELVTIQVEVPAPSLAPTLPIL